MVRSPHKKMDGKAGQGLITLVSQVSKALHRRTEGLMGMRLKQFLTLGYVQDHEGMSQQELGESLLMDENSVVLLLNELEAAGFTVRRRDPADRRRHIVELTPAGRQALERTEKAREAVEAELFGTLSPSERETLRKLLIRALEGLVRVPTA